MVSSGVIVLRYAYLYRLIIMLILLSNFQTSRVYLKYESQVIEIIVIETFTIRKLYVIGSKILITPTRKYLSVMQVIKMILNTFCTYKHPPKIKKIIRS